LDAAAPLGVVSPDEWRRHWPAPAAEMLELPLVPAVVTDDDLLDDVETVCGDDELDLPELADDVDLAQPDPAVDEADQPSSVEPQ
jgi:XTP/dITP diphosphohydrolase